MRKVLEEQFIKFKRDGRGNFAILFALFGAMAVFAAGMAVDYANFLAAQKVPRAALDTATLAVAAELDAGGSLSGDVQKRAATIFELNLKNSRLVDVNAVTGSLRLSQAPGSTEVVGSADLVVPTYFSGIFGFDKLNARLRSGAGFEPEISEFAFVLDNTGSMALSIRGTPFPRNERIDALRAAMRDAIDLLLPESGENDDTVRVGIVPYANAVNLGSFHKDAVNRFMPSFTRNNNTCVTEREGTHSVRDGGATLDIAPVLNVPNASVANQPAVRNTFYETDSALRGVRTNACPRVAIRPLTNDRAALLADVGAFATGLSTGGHMGIDWGFNLLSANWRNFWPAASRPAEYGTRNVRKVLVIMTDGEFNTQYFDNVQGPNFIDTPLSVPSRESRSAALRFCYLAKAPERGIEVYTIALGRQVEVGDPDTPFNILLRDCASADIPGEGAHFLTASSASELSAAFTSIVRQTIRPVLTQ